MLGVPEVQARDVMQRCRRQGADRTALHRRGGVRAFPGWHRRQFACLDESHFCVCEMGILCADDGKIAQNCMDETFQYFIAGRQVLNKCQLLS